MAPKPKLGFPVNAQTLMPLEGSIDDYEGAIYAPIAPVAPNPEPESSGLIRRIAGDGIVTAVKGAIGVPEAAVGLADIATGGRVGKFLENEDGSLGFRPDEAKKYLDTLYSPEQQAAFRAVQGAANPEDSIGQRVLDTGIAAIKNPSTIVHAVGESLPVMGAGGVLARGALAATGATSRAAQIAAAGLGEGAVTAGSSAEAIRQQTPDGMLTAQQGAIAAGSGLATAGLGMVAARAAKALGVGDVDVLIAGGKNVSPELQKGFTRRVLEGAFTEGVLEELPQSVQEQVAQNYALGKPLDDGVDMAAVMGLLSGGAMGAGVNAMSRPQVPEVGPLSRGANVAGATMPQQPAATPPMTAPAATLTPEQEKALLDNANKRAAELAEKEKGSKAEDGAETAPQMLTPAEVQERDFLKQAGGDAQALARAYQPVEPPTAPAAPDAPSAPSAPDPISAPEAPASAREQREADRPAEPTEKHLPTDITRSDGKPFTSMDAAMRAQANAGDGAQIVRVVGGLVVRSENPVELPEPQPGDIQHPNGHPFKERVAAATRLKKLGEGHTIAKVRGGFVIRPPSPAAPEVASDATLAAADILNANDEPFTTQPAAVAAQKREGGEVVKVAGGWVVRQQPTTLGTTIEAQPAGTRGTNAGDVVQERMAGEPIDAEWTAFKPETGTKGIPRADMPQIKAEHRGAMTQFLKGRGITHEQESEVDPASLKPTQAEFAPGKVQRARDFTEGDRAILVSSDGHILDGHHQWLAAMADNKPIRVIRLDAPIEKLIEQVREFPSAGTSDGAVASDATETNARTDEEAQAPNDQAPAATRGDGEQAGARDAAGAGAAAADEAAGLTRNEWERSVAEPLGLQLGGAGWNLPVGNLGEVVVTFTSKPSEPLRAEVSAEYFGKSFDKRTAEGEPAIKEAIERARAGIQEGRERMAREKVAGAAPAALPAAEDSPQARWTRSTEADRIGILAKAGWSTMPPSLSTQKVLRTGWDALTKSQRDRITAALASDATPAQPQADTGTKQAAGDAGPNPSLATEPANTETTQEPPTDGASNAGTVPTDDVPGADPGRVPQGPAADGRDSEPLDAGLAQAGEGADRDGRVPGGVEGADRARADGNQRAGDEPSGASRDGAGVRPEPGATGADKPAERVDGKAGDPATSDTSDQPALDHTIDADDIGKGGLRAKYRDNIAAIKVLRSMDAEGRVATPDERRQIAKYVGWGALKGVFDKANKQWTAEFEELQGLLTEAEYKAARASTLNAHYTSPTVVKAMYSALERLGFTHGRVLEPSVGVGNFFGLMPGAMRKGSVLHGVELDPLTSKIAAALYPNAKIKQATGFQNFDIPAEYFDIAIGNPPFGSEPIIDADRAAYSGFSIHNYFLAKSIDKLRPGGLGVFVVSHSFLDAKDDKARTWIAERANLVGAARLPNTAFKENAGTEVVTDILIFQKHGDGIEAGDTGWTGTTETTLTGEKSGEQTTHRIGNYFAANKGNILGKETAAGRMYRADEYTVEPSGDLDAALAQWQASLPEGIFTPIERGPEQDAADISIPDGVKVGSFFVGPDGKVRTRGPDVMGRRTALAWEPPNAKAEERVRGMIGLRDALRAQMRLEKSTDATSESIERHRRDMKAAYEAFQKKYGYLNDQTNRRLFADDVEAPLMQALEFDYDKGVSAAVAAKEGVETRAASAKPADILSRRVLFPPQENIHVNNAKDALLASLNFKGRIDMPYIRSLYDKSEAEVVEELGDVVFEDPLAGLVTADEYLSGDVKTKLIEAQAAAREDDRFQRNVKSLEKVIPEDKKPSEIHASLGAAFLPGDIYVSFVKHITGADSRVAYVGATGQWIAELTGRADAALNTGQWGTSRMPADKLIALTMAGQVAVVKDTHRNADGSTTTTVNQQDTEAAREKQNAIKAEWQSWLWKDAERADRVATIYNDKMNRIVNRKYDGSHMTFPGMSPGITLLEHQRNAVWRGLQSYQVLLDHVVGAGKTFEMATLAMEWRRLGVARKPLLAVPNHLTLQWRSEFSRLYPAANVLAASPDDFAKGNREKFFSKIVTGDWDAVIVGHSSLKKIGLPPETEQRVLNEQMEELSEAIEEMKRARGDRNIIRDMEGIKARLDAKLQKKLQNVGKRDKVVTFDELGIDAFMVDELHEFKNLYYHSTMERVPGMGNPTGSDKSFDLFVKFQWMNETFGAKAPLVGATGTPVSNSLVEMYNMQRFMQYPTLKKDGLHVFDAWAKQFGKVESIYEVSPSGTGYRASSRFSKFANLPALMGHYGSFADVVTLDDLKAQEQAQGKRFPVPKIAGGRPQNIVAERSPLVAEFMGVPSLELRDDGFPQFGVNMTNDAIETVIEEREGKFFPVAIVTFDDGEKGRTSLGGPFETEDEARMAVVEKALSPKISVNPESILGQFENLREITKRTKGKVNALSLTGAANKAGLDYRLVNPAAADFPGSKINLAVEKAMATYKKWTKDRGTQLIFCDLSTPLSARSGLGNKPRRWYVREDGGIKHRSGTLHTVEGQEQLPVFIVQTGEKDAKSFQVYDAAAGFSLRAGFRTRAEALDWVGETVRDDAKRERWIIERERAGELSPDMVDDYNNANEIDTEESPGITFDDVAGISGSAKFSVYDDIKAKLLARGVPESEIAFIHDYDTPVAKAKLFKAVNDGRVRFLLGSTPKMGAGTNVQERLVGLHHIDAPWRPSDLEQREGRIIRRGNSLYERDPDGFEVEIYRYATAQTYDTRRWQILEHKARGIEQLRKYDGTVNEIEDIDGEAANAADMKAAASGDPLILQETQLRNDVKRLETLQSSHADEVQLMQRRARDAEEYVKTWGPKERAELQALKDKAAANPAPADGSLIFHINGQRFAEKDAAVEALNRKVAELMVGQVSAFKMSFRGVHFEMTREGQRIRLDSARGLMDTWKLGSAVSPSGLLTRFENFIERLDGHIAEIDAHMERRADDAVKMREQAKKPFAQADDLTKAREAHKKVQRRLLAKGPAIPDAEKPMLEQGMERQKEALREKGFGDALDEFLGQRKAADDAMFSRGKAGAGLPVDRVQAISDVVRSNWSNAPQVVVVQSITDPAVPAAVREQAQVLMSRGDEDAGVPEGFYYPKDGRVYLVADQLKTAEDVARVMVHESLGHFGLRGVYGKELGTILDRLTVLNAGKVRAAAKRLGYDFDKTSERRHAAEEVLAHMAQHSPELGWVQRAIAAVRTWLRENVSLLSKMSLSDSEIIRDYILPARRWVERGPDGPRGRQYDAESTLPLFSREDQGVEVAALRALSQNDDIFALPKSTAQTIIDIARDIDPRITVTPSLQEGLDDYKLTMPDGGEAHIFVRAASPYGPHSYGQLEVGEGELGPVETVRPGETEYHELLGDEVYINVSKLKSGGGGAAVYAIAGDFAHNTERVFIGDPAGVTDVAMRRRAEGLLSSALRWGTTAHIAPHPQQVAGLKRIGMPGFKWVAGDHLGNIRRLIDANLKGLENAGYDDSLIRFDEGAGGFRDADGAALSRADIDALASVGIGGRASAGGKTLARAAVLRALLREEGRQGIGAARGRNGLLAQLASRADDGAPELAALFSRVGGIGEALSLNNVRGVKLPAGYILGDLFNATSGVPGRLGWWHKSVGTMYHLAQKNASFKRVYDSVQNFLNDVSYYAAEAADLAPSILPKLENIGDIWKSPLSAADTKALSAPVFEGTLTWARDENGKARKLADIVDELGVVDVHAKAHEMMKVNLIAPEVLRMWQGLPMEQFEAIIEGKWEREYLKPGIVFTPAELREHFGLNDRQIGHYQEFRASIAKSLTNLSIADMIRFGGDDVEVVRQQALDTADHVKASTILRDHLFALAEQQPERAALLNDMGNKMVEKSDRAADLIKRGYAPLSRFGQYTLDVVDEDGQRVYFGMFESAMERSKMARTLKEQFPNAGMTQGTVSDQAYKLFAGVSPETLELFGEMLGLESDASDEASKAFQTYLKVARSSRDSMKRLIERKGIAGFNEDAGRVLAGFVYSNARQTASNLHAKETDRAVNDIPQGQGQLKDEAIRLRDYVKNPQEEAQAFRAVLFAQYLGGSIASAMVNATQPFAVSFPYLSQFGGVKKAAQRMAAAAKDATKKATGDAALDAALKKAEEEGIVSPQEVHSLMAQAMGRAQLRSGDGTRTGDAAAALNNGLSRLSLAWGKVFGIAEQFNRKTTFIAAYRTAVEQGIDNPAAFAEKAVAETQFTYNKGNKPRWARGAVGSVLFTFKQYSVNYVELLHRMATAGEPGSPEREAGRRAALLALAALFLIAGADGLPFAEDVQDVIDGAMQRMGYSFSSKQRMKQFLATQIGKDGAEFVMSGVSGIPGVPIDVSGRLGMGNLIPSTGLFQKKPDHSRDITEVLGVGGDFAKRALTAADQLTSGKAGAAVETMVPVAARNLAKAVDMANTGMYRDQDGRKVLDVSLGEAVAKGIGFQPRDVARVQQASMEVQKAKGQYNVASDAIRDKWALGIFEGDQDKIDAAREELANWNRKNPDQRIQANMPAILKRVREMRKSKAERIAGTAPKAIRAQARKELAEVES